MGAKHGVLLFSELPDPKSEEYPLECFENNAKYMIVHLKSLKDLRDSSYHVRGNVLIEGGLVFYRNLIIGRIVYEVHYASKLKIIEGVEYRMEICIELLKDNNFSIFYEDCRKIMDELLFVEKVNLNGAEWDSKKDFILKKK